jgi:hypothetical protein
MTRTSPRRWLIALAVLWGLTIVLAVGRSQPADARKPGQDDAGKSDDEARKGRQDPIKNATDKVKRGRHVFRFDTFGDQAFWGDTLKLHQAIEGARLGGVGPGVSPATALAVGLNEGRHRRAAEQRARAD